MTDKEALNLLFCTSEGLPENKVYECKKILDKELNELTKYKKAFEILKDVLNLRVYINMNGEKTINSIWDTNDQTETDCFNILSDEQYELLEELIKDESV